jgi:hypothetical protein
MGRDNGSHTTYLVGEAMPAAPHISRTDRSNELRLVPRPPTMYASGHTKLTVGACGSAHGARDNGSHTYLSEVRQVYFSPSYFSDRP